MAKREIKRETEDVINEENKVVETVDTTPVRVELPAEKQARPKAVEPLDISIEVKAPSVFVMRVWNGLVLYPNKFRMEKIPIIPGKPVKIRITQ